MINTVISYLFVPVSQLDTDMKLLGFYRQEESHENTVAVVFFYRSNFKNETSSLRKALLNMRNRELSALVPNGSTSGISFADTATPDLSVLFDPKYRCLPSDKIKTKAMKDAAKLGIRANWYDIIYVLKR